MTADLLRRAAAKIRSTAALASRELDGDPWDTTDPGKASDIENHIALWSPDVALIVAEWIGDSARELEMAGTTSGCDEPGSVQKHLELARRILGEGE